MLIIFEISDFKGIGTGPQRLQRWRKRTYKKGEDAPCMFPRSQESESRASQGQNMSEQLALGPTRFDLCMLHRVSNNGDLA